MWEANKIDDTQSNSKYRLNCNASRTYKTPKHKRYSRTVKSYVTITLPKSYLNRMSKVSSVKQVGFETIISQIITLISASSHNFSSVKFSRILDMKGLGK